jgi:hypothetical protein
MTVVRLPKKLKNEPLIDAIFGVQFSFEYFARHIIFPDHETQQED